MQLLLFLSSQPQSTDIWAMELLICKIFYAASYVSHADDYKV
jgi:hypothetical protein